VVVAAVDLDASAHHLIHRLKCHHDFSVLAVLSDTLLGAVRNAWVPPWPEALLPMPVHPAQRRRRGFNQAQLLARELGRALGIPVCDRGVRRLRNTGSLTEQDAAARRRTLRGAFETGGTLPGRVAIVDDVLTTGASAEALTVALRRAGARQVSVWTVARTPYETGKVLFCREASSRISRLGRPGSDPCVVRSRGSPPSGGREQATRFNEHVGQTACRRERTYFSGAESR